MTGQAEVRGRVPPRRVVTASDVTAFLADPQMHPVLASLSQAVLATPDEGVTSWIRSRCVQPSFMLSAPVLGDR